MQLHLTIKPLRHLNHLPLHFDRFLINFKERQYLKLFKQILQTKGFKHFT
jgi:hypothetical protein